MNEPVPLSAPVEVLSPEPAGTPIRAHVYVTLKRTVLDAQGQTVADALRRMQFSSVHDVRQGKYFLLTLDLPSASNAEDAKRLLTEQVERMAREVLVNPVIEEYTFRIEL